MRRLNWLILPVVAGGVVTLAFQLKPSPVGYGTHQALGLPPCLFLALTGWFCPSCGLTTSFCHFAQGHWLAAFKAHPLGPALFVLLLVLALFSLLEFFGRPTPLGKFIKGSYAAWVYGGLTLFLMAYGGRLIWTYT